MNQVFWYALTASIVSSIGGLAGGVILIAWERAARVLSRVLIGFSAGVLLSVTFFDLFPEALDGFAEPHEAFVYVLIGICSFFLIERLFASIHSHEHTADESETGVDAPALRRSVPLVVFGDSIHNFFDGVTVAVTFAVSIPLGIATAVSVLVHELPHEIADFTILLRSGMTRRKAFMINLYSALVAPLGTVIAYFFTTRINSIEAPLLAIAAGNLLYIAMSDLIPHLHHERNVRRVVVQSILFLAGVAMLAIIPLG